MPDLDRGPGLLRLGRRDLDHRDCRAFSAGAVGRVLGYDSAHGTWHRYYYGRVKAVKAKSFAEIEAVFEKEWLALSRSIEHG